MGSPVANHPPMHLGSKNEIFADHVAIMRSIPLTGYLRLSSVLYIRMMDKSYAVPQHVPSLLPSG